MINLKALNKSFGDIEIYKDVNYSFKENKLSCFLGPSGSGKTTLLNLIAGFDSDYTGEITVEGIKLSDLSIDELCEYRFNNIGFIFQNYNLLTGYTTLENVLMGINLNSDATESEKITRASDLLSSLGIEDKKNENIETLSGGQKQRVAIARALINSPKIILADEPTGALDEEATKSIMEILKEISKEKTVIIITHDEEVADYADEIIELENYDISIKKAAMVDENIVVTSSTEDYKISKKNKSKLGRKISRKLSIKNFRIHFFKFFIAGLIIAFGSAAFVGTLSSKKIMGRIIDEFKTKNFFYNIGQAPIDKKNEKSAEEIFNILDSRRDVESVYYQYDLENITLKNDHKTFNIEYKSPTALSKESLVYGVMPKAEKDEIAIAINIANRLTDDVKSMLGKEIVLQYLDKNNEIQEVNLVVSGLTNSQYQDFVVSSNIESIIYENGSINKDNPTAISFEVKNFEEISKVDSELKTIGIEVFTRAEEVDSFQNSFARLIKLYTGVSYIILLVGMVISAVILYKVSIERYREVGLLGALGYNMININNIMFKESTYFALISTIISCALIFALEAVYKVQFGYGLELSIISFIILIGINLMLTIILSNVINLKLIKTEPALALRK
ncbi:MAG: ABC transporter ATP-binding protein [Clostridium sp.]|nr:ABC transporter ATP-binding protein [Clostridium sp.]